MISLERTKRLLGDSSISDGDAEILRDSVRSLVDIIFEKWLAEKQGTPHKLYLLDKGGRDE